MATTDKLDMKFIVGDPPAGDHLKIATDCAKPRLGIFLGGTSGLGEALEQEFRARGMIDCSAILGSSVELTTGEQITKPNKLNQTFVQCNLKDEHSINQALTWLNKELEQAEPVVYVWGAGTPEKLAYLEQNRVQRWHTSAINFFNGEVFSHKLLKRMNGASDALDRYFIVLGSTASENHKTDEVMYCAAHAAKRSWTESIQLIKSNPKLHICYCLLGGMKTPFWDAYLVERPEFFETYEKFNDPLKVANYIVEEMQKDPVPHTIAALRSNFI